MKRLIEEEHIPGSPEHSLAEFVRATPPIEPGSLQRQRVLVGLTSAVRAHRGGRLAGVGAAGLVLAGATLAAAAVGHWWATGTPRSEPVLTTIADVAPGRTEPHAEVIAPDDLSPADRPTLPPPIALRAASAPPERPSTRVRTNAPATNGEDPAAVLEAIRALRYNGDPVRAGQLLGQYLKAHPRSVLAEDASALSIEAAIAGRNPRSAAELSRRYMAQFPNGRYRAFAIQALQPNAP